MVISTVVASVYVPVAMKCSVFPTPIVELTGVIDICNRTPEVTVRIVLTEVFGSSLKLFLMFKVAVMVVVPAAILVAIPLPLIVATDVFSELQVT